MVWSQTCWGVGGGGSIVSVGVFGCAHARACAGNCKTALHTFANSRLPIWTPIHLHARTPAFLRAFKRAQLDPMCNNTPARLHTCLARLHNGTPAHMHAKTFVSLCVSHSLSVCCCVPLPSLRHSLSFCLSMCQPLPLSLSLSLFPSPFLSPPLFLTDWVWVFVCACALSDSLCLSGSHCLSCLCLSLAV